MRISYKDFDNILTVCVNLNNLYPEIVFIGGAAVYRHLQKHAVEALPPDASHDADFMISLMDYGKLKDVEVVYPNKRLSKHQMSLDRVEFDIYVEKSNALLVPYDEVYAHSTVIEDTRVACLEHLLVLKLEAFLNRRGSPKGDKDCKDIVKVVLMMGTKFRPRLLSPYLRDEMVDALAEVGKSAIFFDMSDRNSHAAKKLRTAYTTVVEALARLG
jgi:hypothetical protein